MLKEYLNLTAATNRSSGNTCPADCHVMVIDDDHMNLFMTKMLLSKYFKKEMELELFSDAETALQYLKNMNTQAPVRILLDIHMPHFDGWYVLDQLQVILPPYADVEVILQSAGISPQDRLKARKYKMVKGLACKPLTAHNLISLFS